MTLCKIYAYKVQDFVEVKNKEYRTPFYRTHPVAASGYNCLTLLLDKKIFK